MKSLYAPSALSPDQRWNIIKKGLLISTLFIFFSMKMFAQVAPYSTRDFLGNVVEIGLSDFGLVTGEDSSNIYFICVRNANGDRIDNNLRNVKLNNGKIKVKATRIQSRRFGNYQIVLYQAPRTADLEWKKDFYSTLSSKKGMLSTFRDKWMSDKIWSILSAKMTVLKQPKEGVVSIKVPREAGIAKGMPLINSEGFIAGIAAESSLGRTTIRAINMKEVALALYTLDTTCRYFSMIELGHTDTRCAEKAAFDAMQKLRQDSLQKLNIKEPVIAKEEPADSTEKVRKSHFIDYGFNANYIAGPAQVSGFNKDYDSETREIHLGISIHFNISKSGARRLTAKPRYGNFNEINEPGLWSNPDNNDVRITRSSYSYAEMPVIFEQRLFKAKKFSMAVGAGYSAGMVFNHKYRLQDKSTSVTDEQTMTATGSAIIHRMIGELYFYEFSFGRLGAVYTRDMSSYPHTDHILTLNGTDYKPFADRKKAWYLGLELNIRLRGKW